MNAPSPVPPGELAIARAAARAYGIRIGLPDRQARELLGPPLLGPVYIDRDGRPVAAYRWLGSGRGGPYLQVEVDHAAGIATVVAGANHDDHEPATYAIDGLGAEQQN